MRDIGVGASIVRSCVISIEIEGGGAGVVVIGGVGRITYFGDVANPAEVSV